MQRQVARKAFRNSSPRKADKEERRAKEDVEWEAGPGKDTTLEGMTQTGERTTEGTGTG